MSSTTKPIIVGLVILMFISLMTARTKTVTDRWVESELAYALKIATQDATSVLPDENYMLDGSEADLQNVRINLKRATNQFVKSFSLNLGAHIDPAVINSMNIPLTGYVGYSSISGVLADGTSTFPYSYTYVVPETDIIYGFTLGDTVYEISGSTTKEYGLDTLREHYFSADISNEDFRTITIMTAISNFLTLFSGAEYSIMAQNAGSGLQFELGKTDYSGDPSVMTNFAAVIDGPGFFAVTDMMDPKLSGITTRIFTFGAAELVSKV